MVTPLNSISLRNTAIQFPTGTLSNGAKVGIGIAATLAATVVIVVIAEVVLNAPIPAEAKVSGLGSFDSAPLQEPHATIPIDVKEFEEKADSIATQAANDMCRLGETVAVGQTLITDATESLKTEKDSNIKK